MIPLSLYIHIPWCEKKCPYCDFNSHQSKSAIEESNYIDALLNDFKQDLSIYKDSVLTRPIKSIFIGGGTPSLFTGSSIKSIIDRLSLLVEFDPDIEITLEANPGSSEAQKFAEFREAGVNRLSIGIQSLNDAHLKALGRVHNANQAIHAVTKAREAGFESFNLDLMYGLPDQTLDQAVDDLSQLITLAPTHISCYQLTIEPNTLFHHQPPVTPSDEILWEMQTELQKHLKQNNYLQYEVSAYAQPNKQSIHNSNYWQFGDYLGIGAGAHGKITNSAGEITRYWKIKHPETYSTRAINNQSTIGASNIIKENELPLEFMMNALRLTEGFALGLFQQRTQLSTDLLLQLTSKHRQNNHLELDNEILKPTTRGRQLLDSLLQDYLP